MKKLAMALMVKDETNIIERCLSSLLVLQPDLIVVTDTGSSDNTILKIVLFLTKYTIPFKIYQEKFINFAHNRNLLLERCRKENVDYILMIDADEVIVKNQNFNINEIKKNLNNDLYDITMGDLFIEYRLPRLTSNKIKPQYCGVTHEFLNEETFSKGFIPGFSIKTFYDSSRRITDKKYENDILLLEEALKTGTNEQLIYPRYLFYLAQSYFNINNKEKALETYLKRLKMGGWKEELFYSHYSIGKIYAEKNAEIYFKEALFHYLEAYVLVPTRAESLKALENLCIKTGRLSLAVIFEEIRKKIKKPEFGLFIERLAYD